MTLSLACSEDSPGGASGEGDVSEGGVFDSAPLDGAREDVSEVSRDAADDARADAASDDATPDDATPDSAPLELDCLGEPGGQAVEDACGACDADPENDCAQDCAGAWGGAALEDECGVCDEDPNNDCAQDCAGAWGGAALEDQCGVCDEDPTNDCEAGCDGVWGSPAREDECGVCDEDPNNDCAQDCAGAWGGAALEDECGVCDEDPDNDCQQDCTGAWGGAALEDRCGACDEDPRNDCAADCAGAWGGAAITDRCGYCVQPGAECRVATMYFGGTGTHAGWWSPNNTTWGTTPELLSLMHYAHRAGDDDAKVYIEGVSQGCIVTPGICLGTCFRCFGTAHGEAERWLDATVNRAGWAGRRIVVNLVGWSRGSISALRFSRRAQTMPGVDRLNIIVVDPVPGDSRLADYPSELCVNVDRLVSMYAWDERSDSFEPLIYDDVSADSSIRFAVRGSHETLVGNVQVDGHSYTGGLLPDYSIHNNNLIHSLVVVASVTHQLLRAPQWGGVRFADEFSGFDRGTFLESVEIMNSEHLNGMFTGMRGFCYAPLCHAENCGGARCGNHIRGCPSPQVIWDTDVGQAAPAIHLLGAPQLPASRVWDDLLEMSQP